MTKVGQGNENSLGDGSKSVVKVRQDGPSPERRRMMGIAASIDTSMKLVKPE